jgi:hypothetical protein
MANTHISIESLLEGATSSSSLCTIHTSNAKATTRLYIVVAIHKSIREGSREEIAFVYTTYSLGQQQSSPKSPPLYMMLLMGVCQFRRNKQFFYTFNITAGRERAESGQRAGRERADSKCFVLLIELD